MGADQVTRHEPVRDIPNVPVRMVREPLDGVPAFALPDGYAVRWFRPGDDETWARIHDRCEGYEPLSRDLFARDFGTDLEVLRQRIAFVRDPSGEDVATAAAWFNNYRGRPFGRLHWVATARSSQGKGLTKGLVCAVCRRMLELGHERAYLTTNSVRLRAIGLYSRFGFVPDIDSDGEAEAWKRIGDALAVLGRPLSPAHGKS